MGAVFVLLGDDGGSCSIPSVSNCSKNLTHCGRLGTPAGVVHPINSHIVLASSVLDNFGYVFLVHFINSISSELNVLPENSLIVSLMTCSPFLSQV